MLIAMRYIAKCHLERAEMRAKMFSLIVNSEFNLTIFIPSNEIVEEIRTGALRLRGKLLEYGP